MQLRSHLALSIVVYSLGCAEPDRRIDISTDSKDAAAVGRPQADSGSLTTSSSGPEASVTLGQTDVTSQPVDASAPSSANTEQRAPDATVELTEETTPDAAASSGGISTMPVASLTAATLTAATLTATTSPTAPASGSSSSGCTSVEYCPDSDGDSYCNLTACVSLNCPTSTVPGLRPRSACLGADCNDTDAAINPGKTELCNGSDDDCDTLTDEDFGVGSTCSVPPGQGACAAAGKTQCATTTSTVCSVPAGIPNSAFHNEPAPNGSWDWDCNGTTEKQYPDVSPSTRLCSNYSSGNCTEAHYYADTAAGESSACGGHLTKLQCTTGMGNDCVDIPSSSGHQSVTQGCH